MIFNRYSKDSSLFFRIQVHVPMPFTDDCIYNYISSSFLCGASDRWFFSDSIEEYTNAALHIYLPRGK